ncbi:MAG: hypothetical protein EHM72_21220, partial [Calditrichaeota bacterium]
MKPMNLQSYTISLDAFALIDKPSYRRLIDEFVPVGNFTIEESLESLQTERKPKKEIKRYRDHYAG